MLPLHYCNHWWWLAITGANAHFCSEASTLPVATHNTSSFYYIIYCKQHSLWVADPWGKSLVYPISQTSECLEQNHSTLSPIIMVQWKMAGYLKGSYYWRDPFFTSMIMGGRVTCYKLPDVKENHCVTSRYNPTLGAHLSDNTFQKKFFSIQVCHDHHKNKSTVDGSEILPTSWGW